MRPTFDPATCVRPGRPTDVDGGHDVRLHSIGGECILDCVTHQGSFHDVPARVLAAETPRPGPFACDGALRRFGGTEAGS